MVATDGALHDGGRPGAPAAPLSASHVRALIPGLDLRVGSKVYRHRVSSYTIGEAAERSGFSASALRYYEGIGLVEPSNRTEAGYRVYDDATLRRLAFIARAKQLGCSLDEIADLVGIWDGEQCAPVQRRFHELVTTKLVETERQIDELTAFSAQLREAAARLSRPALDGPCDERCVCFTMKRIPLYDATVPIVCTIDATEIPARRELLDRIRASVLAVERTPDGFVLQLSSNREADVRAFVNDEKRCCGFWGFDVTRDTDTVALRWDGPPDVAPLVDQLVAYFRREADLDSISGLF